jgi:hypothetical protein
MEPVDPLQPTQGDVVAFEDCRGFAITVEVPGDWVRAKMPPGYEPFTGPAKVQGVDVPMPIDVSLPGIVVNQCTISWPDGGREEDVPFAFSLVALDAAGGHGIEDEQEDAYDDYALELFFDVKGNPALARHFLAYDWPVHDAAIDLGPETFHILATEGIDYQGMLGVSLFPYAGNETGEDPTPTRYHHVGRAPSFGTLGDLERRSYTIYAGTLLAQGGFFGTLGGPEGTKPFAGIGQLHMIEGPSSLQWAEATDGPDGAA